MVIRPARNVIPKNGRPDHTLTSTMANRARPALPSQGTGADTMPKCISAQLNTLNEESNIHVHARTLSATGVTQGTSTAPRIHFIPGARCARTSASTSPTTSFTATATTVYHTVFQSVNAKI